MTVSPKRIPTTRLRTLSRSVGTDASDGQGLGRTLTHPVTIGQKQRAKGIEPFAEDPQLLQDQSVRDSISEANAQIRAQIRDSLGRDLAEVVAAWPALAVPLKTAILAIVRSSNTSLEGER